MPKKSKKESSNGTAATADENVSAPATVDAPAAAAKPAKSPRKSARKVAAKKSSAKTPRKKPSPAEPTSKPAPDEPSEADIRLRAYFIAEHRAQQSLEGDPTRDWIEARRQLRAEAGLE